MPIIDATALATARTNAGYGTAALGAAATHTGQRYYAVREDGTLPNASRLVMRRWMKLYEVSYADITKEPAWV